MREAFGRTAPELLVTEYAHEIWKLYEAGQLQPESPLTGRFEHDRSEVDVVAVLDHIEDERLFAEERERRREEAAAGV
jgi:RIO kinase 1